MWIDPIIEELHAQRKEHAARFGYDVHSIFLELKRLEAAPSAVASPLVTLPPKPVHTAKKAA